MKKTVQFHEWLKTTLESIDIEGMTFYDNKNTSDSFFVSANGFLFTVTLPFFKVRVLTDEYPFTSQSAHTLEVITHIADTMREIRSTMDPTYNEVFDEIGSHFTKWDNLTCKDCECQEWTGKERISSYYFPLLGIILCDKCLERSYDIFDEIVVECTTTYNKIPSRKELDDAINDRFEKDDSIYEDMKTYMLALVSDSTYGN